MIRIYIVTYKRNDILNRNLTSLWASLSSPEDVQVTVIANHPEVVIDPANSRANLSIRINETRPTNAWGYLSRDWNFGLLDAFRDSENSNNTNWAVLAQNDVVWSPGWQSRLLEEKRYDFISQPRGDQLMAFRIEGVRRIGFFDERFFTLHFQEVDYFYRAILQHPERASVNDDHIESGCVWNGLDYRLIEPTFSGVMENDQLHTVRSNRELGYWLMNKWRIPYNKQVHDLVARCAETKERGVLPTEINWYPFFWKKPEPCCDRFLEEYKKPPFTLRWMLKMIRARLRELKG